MKLCHRVQDSAKHGPAAVQLPLIELEERLLSFSLLLADKRDLAAQNQHAAGTHQRGTSRRYPLWPHGSAADLMLARTLRAQAIFHFLPHQTDSSLPLDACKQGCCLSLTDL
jgi:hypothetical protein